MKKANRKRSVPLCFRVTPEEQEIISEKMEQAGIKNREAYLRKQAIDGYVIRLDLSDVQEMVRLLRITSNNLNQIAKRANETRNIYKTDIQDLQVRYDQLWGKAEDILKGLAHIRTK